MSTTLHKPIQLTSKLRKRARKGFWVVSAPKSHGKRDACWVTSIGKNKIKIPINVLPDLGTRQQLAKLDLPAMAVQFPHIAFSLTVRDLGLTLDQQLTFAPHINRLCRDCYYQLRQLRVISRSLTSTATA